MIAEAITQIDINGLDIAAIGITNQRETTIVWDIDTEEPIYHAIVWQDRRTAEYCDKLKAQGLVDKVREKTGLIIDAYFSGTKIKWILDNVTGARKRAEMGKVALWQCGFLADLASDPWHGSCHRCHQRFAYHAFQHQHAAIGMMIC